MRDHVSITGFGECLAQEVVLRQIATELFEAAALLHHLFDHQRAHARGAHKADCMAGQIDAGMGTAKVDLFQCGTQSGPILAIGLLRDQRDVRPLQHAHNHVEQRFRAHVNALITDQHKRIPAGHIARVHVVDLWIEANMLSAHKQPTLHARIFGTQPLDQLECRILSGIQAKQQFELPVIQPEKRVQILQQILIGANQRFQDGYARQQIIIIVAAR